MFDTKTLCGTIGKTEAAVRHAASLLPMESVAVERHARAWTLRDALAITIVDALVSAGMPAATACEAVSDAAAVFERITTDAQFHPWSVITSDAAGAFQVELFEEPTDALAAVLVAGNARTIAWPDLVRDAVVRLLEAQRALKEGRAHV